MEEVPESLWHVPKYGFYDQDSQAMDGIGNQSQESSSKYTYEQNRKEAEGLDEEDMQIIEVSKTDRADAMSALKGTAGNVCVLNVYDYHQNDFLVRIK